MHAGDSQCLYAHVRTAAPIAFARPRRWPELPRHASRAPSLCTRATLVWMLTNSLGPDGLGCRGHFHGEFDPGSGRTLAACLTHASGATNQGLPWGKAAN